MMDKGRAPHLRRHRARRGDRPSGVDPRLQLGRHLGLDLHRRCARAARRPRLLPHRAARHGVQGALPGPPHLLQGAVRPRGAARAHAPDPGRPLLAGGAAATGRSPTGPGSRSASWTATSTPSRRCAPSRPESWFLSYGLDEMAARPSPQIALFMQPVSLFREIRPLLAGGDFHWQSAALLELLAERPHPRLVNFYTHQPDSDQHWFWKWYEPETLLRRHRRGTSQENGGHHPRALPRFRRLPRPACSPRPGRTPS